MTEAAYYRCDAPERVALQGFDLSLDRAGVARYLLGEFGELRANHHSERQDDAERQHHG
jgi:hypothetical protein